VCRTATRQHHGRTKRSLFISVASAAAPDARRCGLRLALSSALRLQAVAQRHCELCAAGAAADDHHLQAATKNSETLPPHHHPRNSCSNAGAATQDHFKKKNKKKMVLLGIFFLCFLFFINTFFRFFLIVHLNQRAVGTLVVVKCYGLIRTPTLPSPC
jgi:hypothetical protein